MVWVLGFFIITSAVCFALFWGRRRHQHDLEAAIDPLGGAPKITPHLSSWPNPRAKHAATPPRPVRPVILVASFDSDSALKRAAEAFDAAQFTSDDYLCFYQNRNVASAFAYNLKLSWKPKSQADESCNDHVVHVHELINSRRPVVIVRRRFMKACDIIEATGGRLGCSGY